MEKQLLLITGLSGSGKTTLTSRLTTIFDCNCLFISDEMRRIARNDGFLRLTDYFNYYGAKEGFNNMRPQLLVTLQKGTFDKPVIVDGVYDKDLFKDIVLRFGRKNIIIASMDIAESERQKRISISRQKGRNTIHEMIRRDNLKYTAGVIAIMANADIILNDSLSDNISRIKERLGWVRK